MVCAKKSFWIGVKMLKLGAQGHQLQNMQIAILRCRTNLHMWPSPKRQSFHDILHAAPEPYSEIPKSHKEEEEEEAIET